MKFFGIARSAKGGDVAEAKTKQTEESVASFLDGVADPQRHKDCLNSNSEISDFRFQMWDLRFL